MITKLTAEVQRLRLEQAEQKAAADLQEDDLNTCIATLRLIETPGPSASSPADLAATALDMLKTWHRPGWVDRMKEAAEQA
jgi:hypothetical protein